MARTTLSFVRNADSILNAKLNRLENSLDKDTAHLRKHREELLDIQLLYQSNKIDKDHAEHLAARSKEIYEDKEYKRKNPKQKPVKSYKYIGHHRVSTSDPFYNPDMSLPWYKRFFSLYGD